MLHLVPIFARKIRQAIRPGVRSPYGKYYQKGMGAGKAYPYRSAARWHKYHGKWPGYAWGKPYHYHRNYYGGYRPWVWTDWGGLAAWLAISRQPIIYRNYYYPTEYYSTEYYTTTPPSENSLSEDLVENEPADSAIDDQGSTVEQIAELADLGKDLKEDPNRKWMPLGIFAITPNAEVASDIMVQLAVSKDGMVEGSYHNRPAEVTLPIYGAVDKKSQKVAWRIKDGAILMETGLNGLTESGAKVKVVFEGDATEMWQMHRLTKQQAEEAGMQLDSPPTPVDQPKDASEEKKTSSDWRPVDML